MSRTSVPVVTKYSATLRRMDPLLREVARANREYFHPNFIRLAEAALLGCREDGRAEKIIATVAEECTLPLQGDY